MPRYQKLDRDQLLDATLRVILEQGPHEVTFGNIAAAAGVTKGGIQSNFGTKEKLIDALFDRWSRDLDSKIAMLAAENKSLSPLEVFLQACLGTNQDNYQQDAAMFILMSFDKKHRQMSQQWIANKLKQFDLDEKTASPERLKFVTLQSLVIVRSLGLMPFSDGNWKEIYDQLDNLFIE